MTIEQQKEASPKFREIGWVSNQIKEELKRFNKERFYEKDDDEYNMDTVKQYLGVLKEKKTWKELISKNSSAMVMAVQIALYSQNYEFGTVDGILGEKTKTAIRKFQADNNLQVDTLGRSMPSTIEKLLEVISREDKVEIPEEEKQEAQEIIENKEKSDKRNNDNQIKTGNNEKKQKIDNKQDYKTELNQNTIRPEIKEWSKHPISYANNFKNLNEITYAEAKAIHQDEERQQEIWYSYLLPLSGVKEVTPEIFEELLKHKGVLEIGIENLTPGLAQKIVDQEKNNIGKDITFSGLKALNLEVCEILGDTKGFLTLDTIESITADEIGKLSKKPKGNISLNAIKEITPDIIKAITNSPCEIYMNGIKEIDLPTAKELLKKTAGKIHLEGLEGPLSDEVLNELSKVPSQRLKLNRDIIIQIFNYEKKKRREGKILSQTILEIVDGRTDIKSLNKLESITYDEVVELNIGLRRRKIDLSGVKEITPEAFGELLKHEGNLIIGITNLTPELAEKLEGSKKSITFSGLENISPEAYKYLGKSTGVLQFNVLKNITTEGIGELTKNPGGRIYLNAIEQINPETAEKISKSPRDIYLNGITNIDLDTARELSAKKTGEIHLEGLKSPLSNEILDELANMPRKVLKLKQDNEAGSIYGEVNERRRKKEESKI